MAGLIVGYYQMLHGEVLEELDYGHFYKNKGLQVCSLVLKIELKLWKGDDTAFVIAEDFFSVKKVFIFLSRAVSTETIKESDIKMVKQKHVGSLSPIISSLFSAVLLEKRMICYRIWTKTLEAAMLLSNEDRKQV